MRNGDSWPRLDLAALRHQSVRGYLLRFGFGATISLVAALVGMRFGPHVGGLLLAFPAILPASLTLIEHKEGRHEAVIDARGAIMGAAALIAFAIVAAWTLARLNPVLSIAAAGLVWAAAAVALYVALVRRPWRRARPPATAAPKSR
ncbi:MAG: DUF3147 family protein [Candidatus Dormibacteraceae bacterium]